MPAAASPLEARFGVVTIDLLVNGKAVQTELLSISITREVNRIPTARLVIRDGNPAERTFPESEGNDFIPGNELQIKLGYNSKNTTVFKGFITKHAIRLHENGFSELNIEARDKAVKMTLGRKNKYFTEQKDSEIIEALISNHGLQSDVKTTTLKHSEVVQHHATDWDFMMTRAEANGLLVLVKDGKLTVALPKVESTADFE